MTNRLMANRLSSERGTTLIETMIALCVLLVVMGGLMTISAMSSTTTENNGHLAARTTEDAQDKMEQLLVLAYTDTGTDTTVFPAASTGGTDLAIGGSSNPAAPVAGYVDWLAADGSWRGGGVSSIGMPRELKTMHAVLPMGARAASRHAGAWRITGCVFAGAAPTTPKPNVTPVGSDVVPPEATHAAPFQVSM